MIKYVFLVFLIASCEAKNKNAYINPNVLLQGYRGATLQHELFKTKAQDWQRRVDSLSSELKALNKTPNLIHASKEQQLLRYRDAIQQQAQQENYRLTQAVLAEINVYIKQYGKQHGYTFILGATESGNIVYAAEGTDITAEVLKSLNAQYDRQHPSTTP